MYQINMSRPLPLSDEKIVEVKSLDDAKTWLENNRILYVFEKDSDGYDAADAIAAYVYNKNHVECYHIELIK